MSNVVDIKTGKSKVGSVMVVGGGIGGIQAALDSGGIRVLRLYGGRISL